MHVDLAPNYSTEKFLMVLRRFVSLRGYPAKMISDNGTQLTAQTRSSRKLWHIGIGMNWPRSVRQREWIGNFFRPTRLGERDLRGSCIVKSVKKAITLVVGESVMTFSELQTLCYEAANLVNESW